MGKKRSYGQKEGEYIIGTLDNIVSASEIAEKIRKLKGCTHEGIKHDDGKLQWSLLELKNLEPMLKVLMFGANKYAPDNWKKVPDAKKRYYDAFMRHFAAYQAGELIDEESGLPHLDHAQCCLYFLSYFEQKDTP